MAEQKPKRLWRKLAVTYCHQVSKNMRRITLAGEALTGFPEKQDGGYIKLRLPCADGGEPYVRTFSIRKQRSEKNEMDVDFALHEGHAPASNWAAQAKVGDEAVISGPGTKKLIEQNADWFFLASDMTGLPALSVNLETLPAAAKGYAVIEVLSEEDIQVLDAPKGIELHWVVNPKPGSDAFSLVKKVEELAWKEGVVSVWAACEFSSMRRLRSYFKKTRSVARENIYISSYWKLGVAEDQHKRIKRKDNEEHDAIA